MIFLQLPDKEKIELINQMHNETNLPQVIIEKDLWVTAVLRALFELSYADNISFKGGTSLRLTLRKFLWNINLCLLQINI